MQIHDDYLKCVAFLYLRQTGTKGITANPIGTAFFVEVPLDHPDTSVLYIITCNHVIEKRNTRDIVIIRINSLDGGHQDIPIPNASWFIWPQADIAIARVESQIDTLSYRAIKLDWFFTDEKAVPGPHGVGWGPWDYGIGTDVFYTGLFSGYRGVKRNYPVARFATIALMPPEEKLTLRESPRIEIDGYLIETRSWGGYSGSPVFLYPPTHHPQFSPMDKDPVMYAPILLGVLHAHYDIPGKVKHRGQEWEHVAVDINSGLAVVSKAQHLLNCLNDKRVEMDRKKLKRELERPTVTLDSAQIAHRVIEQAIGEPLALKKKPKKPVRKTKNASR